ncbi:MAG: hypothetical protein CXT77_05330 [uncultured DHVE6 group euryarchaeote]|nr:MAG: hypothetical protein CXT77_05330 [uncultured DHVE6 group euryarchaeote]
MFEFLTDINLSFGPIIGIVFILISILFLSRFVSSKPSSAEIESISKNPALNKAVSTLKGSEKKVKEVGKESEQEESEAAEGAKEEEEEEGSTDGAEAVLEVAAETRASSEAETALEKTEERVSGEIAFLNTINSLIKDYVHREEEEAKEEERDEEHMTSLVNNLQGKINFQNIDATAAQSLITFESYFQADLGKEMSLKKQKETDLKSLTKNLGKTVKGLRGTVKGAKHEEGVFEKKEKVQEKTFKAEFRTIRRTIRGKYRAIVKELSKFKKADQGVISNLRQEISILKENSGRLKNFSIKLGQSYKMLNKQIKQINNLQKSISKKERVLEKNVKNLEKSENKIEKTYKKIDETYEAFKQNMAKKEGYQPRMLELSNNINKFSKANEKMAVVTPGVQKKIKRTIIFVGDMIQSVRGYISIVGTIEQTEEVLDEAGANVAQLLEGIITSPSEKVPEEALKKSEASLAEQKKIAEQVAKDLTRFTQQMSIELKNTYVELDKLPLEDQQLLTMLQGISQKLGSFAAAVIGQKVIVDKEYLKKSDQFAKQLDQRNAAAAISFNQAKKAVPT